MKKRLIYVALLLSVFLCGCSEGAYTADKQDAIPTATPAQAEKHIIEVSLSDISPAATPNVETTEPPEKEIVAPTKEQVLAAREQALEGMTEEQISDLTEFVKRANLWLEHNYMYSNFFELMENPDYPIWNFFHQTGEIQTGWAYDGDLDKEEICESEGLSENEFYDKYGTPVCETNVYDADGFAAAIASLKSSVQNKDLIDTLQYISDESLLARDTHDVVHVKNIYHALHDLDYFLLRYGLEDVGPYVTDTSTIAKFYGTLSCYK